MKQKTIIEIYQDGNTFQDQGRDRMKTQESILDDETLFFAYFQAAIRGRSKSFSKTAAVEYARSTAWAVEEHRKRFPRRKKCQQQIKEK